MSALETTDTSLLTNASEDSPALGFKTSGGICDRDGRGEREDGDDVTPLEPKGPLLAGDDGDEANRLIDNRCKSGGLVEERGRGLRGPALWRGMGLVEDGSLFEGGGVDCCDKVKRERERERKGVSESAVAGRRAGERCDACKYGSAVDGRTLVRSGATELCGELGVLVAVDGRRAARSEWRLEGLAALEPLRDRVREPGAAVKST